MAYSQDNKLDYDPNRTGSQNNSNCALPPSFYNENPKALNKEKSEIEKAYDYVCDAIRILENDNPPNLWDIRIFLNKASSKLEKLI